MALEPIAPGLAQVPVRSPTLLPATHTNAVVLGARRYTVIDPAGVEAADQASLALALASGEVERIVLSHHHPDHMGGAQDLRARTGAPIFAHSATAARLSFAVDGLLDEGDRVEVEGRAWQVLHTPGHAPGHLCLFDERDGSAVVGDMLAGVGTILIVPGDGDLGDYLHHLSRLGALGAARLVPAHGPTLPPEAVGQYIRHRHMRSEQVRAGLHAARGPARPEALVAAIYPDLPASFYGIAALQVTAHLDWLVGRGEARQEGDGYVAAGGVDARVQG
jgi:ribonuclease/clavin/mitogillin